MTLVALVSGPVGPKPATLSACQTLDELRSRRHRVEKVDSEGDDLQTAVMALVELEHL